MVNLLTKSIFQNQSKHSKHLLQVAKKRQQQYPL